VHPTSPLPQHARILAAPPPGRLHTPTAPTNRTGTDTHDTHGAGAEVGAGAGGGAARPVKIVCVNLLRTAQGKSRGATDGQIPGDSSPGGLWGICHCRAAYSDSGRWCHCRRGSATRVSLSGAAGGREAAVGSAGARVFRLARHEQGREGEAGAAGRAVGEPQEFPPCPGLSLGVFLPRAAPKSSPGTPAATTPPGAWPCTEVSVSWQYQEWERRTVASLHASPLSEGAARVGIGGG